jgi:predicted nuclease of restriction endonuclease-like RecB superfamily
MPREPSVRAIQPNYLTERDYPWLRALVEERERFVGRKRSEWEQRIADGLSINAPRQKLSAALRVLQRLAPDAVKSAVAPRQIRAVLFREAATVDRRVALTNAAQKLGICEQTIEESVFADLAGERRLEAIQAPALDELALRSNVELIGQWLSRALRVRLKAAGKVRAVVRHAKLMGLLCHATSGGQKDEAELEISGPFALFRHTRIYARALTSLVPRLAWCHSFRLEADCVLGAGDRLGRLVLRHGDPLFPARELPAFDSKLEERFAKGFAKIAPQWDVVREPVAIQVGESLFFPDFELRHRSTGESWLLEVVGYWTPEYVKRKFATLSAARCDRLIMCIDAERCCSDEPIDLDAHVVRYRRRLDPRAVLAKVDPLAYEALPAAKPTKRGGRRQCKRT